MFANKRHYVACFKDVTFEAVCTKMQEVTLSIEDVSALTAQQLGYLETEG